MINHRHATRTPLLGLALLGLAVAAAACGGSAADPSGSRPDSASLTERPPCEVETVLEAHCFTCHGPSPSNGAPMSLASHDDFVHNASAIEGVLSRGEMPPQGTLPTTARDVLLEWAKTASADARSVPSCTAPNRT